MNEGKPVKQVARGRAANGTFLPGSSANPKGRPPRDCCLSDAMYALLSSDPESVIKKWQKKGKLTGARRSAIAWYKKVNAADMTALKEALDRVEGKVAQPVTGEGGGPISHTFTVKTESAADLTKKVIAGERTE